MLSIILSRPRIASLEMSRRLLFLQRCDRHLLLDCKTHWSRFLFDWPIFAAIEFRCRVIQRWTGQRKVNGKFRREIRLKRSQWVGEETFPWGEGVAETFERDEDEGWLKRRDGTVRRYSFATVTVWRSVEKKWKISQVRLFSSLDSIIVKFDVMKMRLIKVFTPSTMFLGQSKWTRMEKISSCAEIYVDVCIRFRHAAWLKSSLDLQITARFSVFITCIKTVWWSFWHSSSRQN